MSKETTDSETPESQRCGGDMLAASGPVVFSSSFYENEYLTSSSSDHLDEDRHKFTNFGTDTDRGDEKAYTPATPYDSDHQHCIRRHNAYARDPFKILSPCVSVERDGKPSAHNWNPDDSNVYNPTILLLDIVTHLRGLDKDVKMLKKNQKGLGLPSRGPLDVSNKMFRKRLMSSMLMNELKWGFAVPWIILTLLTIRILWTFIIAPSEHMPRFPV